MNRHKSYYLHKTNTHLSHDINMLHIRLINNEFLPKYVGQTAKKCGEWVVN